MELKYDTDQHIYKTKTASQIQRTGMWPQREGSTRGKEEFGVSRGKLLDKGWMNKVLLYNTRKYIYYPVTNHN